ncbi:unnamed protein product [Cunninghamella echinulata]
MNKYPQITGKPADFCIFHKYSVYKIDTKTWTGNVISSYSECVPIPGWEMTEIHAQPYTIIYRFPFDYHTMMILLSMMDDVDILEYKEIMLTQSLILYQCIKIEVIHGIFSYSGIEDIDVFRQFCQRVKQLYEEEEERIRALFVQVSRPFIDSSTTHLALSYEIWYRGSRENQREWPPISTQRINDDSIEFPKESGIWYTPPPGYYVGLSKRHDDNIHLYIPKLYKQDHRLCSSYLNNYIDNVQTFKPFSMPLLVKKTVKDHGKLFNKYYDKTNEACITVGCNGEVMYMDQCATHIAYRDKVVGKLATTMPYIDLDVQLLDRYFNRSKILRNGVWKNSDGLRINNVITLPWYYRQIVHDYHKLGRLDNGPYMDLMHIGIVDEYGTDRITFPISERLYIARSLETHRLLTFSFKPNIQMVTSKKLSNIDHGVGIIKNAILDNIIERVKLLDLDENAYMKIMAIFDDEKENISIRKKKREVYDLDKPKKVIPLERQCTRKSKDGKACGAIRTNDVVKSCWAHMSQAEKDEHMEMKKSNVKTSNKYKIRREAEDMADE